MVIDHKEFVNRIKEALRDRSSGRPDDAVVKLRALLQGLDPAIKASVNDWHRQQALSLLVDVLDSTDRKDECQATWKELIEFNQNHLKYWQIASASAGENFKSWKDLNSPKD